jgi:restriction system protein
MSLWLIRAGKYGEYESRFLQDARVYLTWGELSVNDLTSIPDYAGIKALLQQAIPGETGRKIGNWSGQIWAFALAMKVGDWVAVPSKTTPTIAIGEIVSPCVYDATAEPLYRHSRQIRWLNTQVPRTAFDQDILYSLGATLTICNIQRNDAERRVRAMAQNGWHSASAAGTSAVPVPQSSGAVGPDDDDATADVDLEQLARDSIARLIIQKFMGHGMARLVEAVLKAQGFTTHLSPPGADRGIDILAAGGPFGFDHPRICVQVKSGDTPADRPEFTQLIGAMQSVAADQGLFVSWSGFKPTVTRELPTQFFKVRVWTANDLVEHLLANYDALDPDIKAELPLKRIWTIATPED